MKKLFGDYLVGKELISREQLLETLIIQARQLPTTLDIIYQHKILSPDEILNILRHLVENDCKEFIAGAKALNLWTSEKAKCFDEVLQSHRTPIGQLLVSAGFLKQNQLLDALDEYLNEVDEENNSSKQGDPVSISESIDSPRFSSLEGPRLDYYLRHFNEPLKKKIFSSVISGNFEYLAFQFRSLRGLAQFLNLTLTGRTLSNCESLVQEVLYDRKSKVDVELDLFSAIEELWEIRESIATNSSEKPYWDKIKINTTAA